MSRGDKYQGFCVGLLGLKVEIFSASFIYPWAYFFAVQVNEGRIPYNLRWFCGGSSGGDFRM